MTLYLANFKYSTTAAELRALLEDFGPVAEVRICLDSQTELPKGIAFAEMAESDALRAIDGLNGIGFGGRRLTVARGRNKTSPQEVTK